MNDIFETIAEVYRLLIEKADTIADPVTKSKYLVQTNVFVNKLYLIAFTEKDYYKSKKTKKIETPETKMDTETIESR